MIASRIICRNLFVLLRNAFDFNSVDVCIDAEPEGSHTEGKSGEGQYVCEL
jgi:hypothetical protein